jgi:hypothetical protein
MATTDELTALAQDGYFRQRVRNLTLLEAAAVCSEVNTTPNHSARMTYAIKLIATPGLADQIADFLCARTNLTGSTVTYDFSRRAPITNASDAAIRSQIATDWNVLSGLIT